MGVTSKRALYCALELSQWVEVMCSYEDSVRGATFVFHTASPFILKVPRGAERELLIDPAVRGTENIIGAYHMHGQHSANG